MNFLSCDLQNSIVAKLVNIMHNINYHNNLDILSVVQFWGAVISVNIILCTHFTALKNNTTDKMITGV